MRKNEDIKTKLETLKPLLKERYQVETVGFFGSYARGEQKKKSDLDVFVEFSQPNTIDLLDFIELEEFIIKKLGVKVDLVTKSALKPMIKEQILKETIYAWRKPTLAHEYFGVNIEILWKTAKNRLSSLKPLVNELLKDTEETK